MMRRYQGLICTVLAPTLLLNAAGVALARGGGGGGHAGGGGHHGGGGHGYHHGGYGHHGYGHYGHGWGYRGYGWGYPYYGYGVGLGLGLGVGYGLGYASSYRPYGSYGYYGYGAPYSYAYDPYLYGPPAYIAPATPVYGPPAYVAPAAPAYGPPPAPAPATYRAVTGAQYSSNIVQSGGAATSPTPPAPLPAVDPESAASAREFAEQGDAAFRAGDYSKAIYAWRHAAVDDPRNPKLLLLLGQALFASGKFDEAAGATQTGLRQLPKTEWGSVVTRYRELYTRPEDYTEQLRVLEKAVSDKPAEPAPRFLLAYHYAYLGFRKQAIDQLDRLLNAQPRDEIARTLRDEMSGKLAKSATPTPSGGLAYGADPSASPMTAPGENR